jgi:hypothetical protein
MVMNNYTETNGYTEKRGTKYEDVVYLSDATDSGVTYVEYNRLISLWNHHQTWHFTEVMRKTNTNARRVYIARNAYDDQSYARLEYLTPTGWIKVHEIGISGTPAEHVSYVQKLGRVDVELFRRTADILWDVDSFIQHEQTRAAIKQPDEFTPEEAEKLIKAILNFEGGE